MNQAEASNDFNRRDFLKGGSLAAFVTMMGGVPLLAEPAPETKSSVELPTPKTKVAVIGLGPWGREILDLLSRSKRAEIVAICDNYPPMLRRSATKAPGAIATEEYNTVLENKDVQAVIVATGSHQHKDIVIAALKAGKHVYCEAPLAHTIEDAKALALAAKNSVGQVFQAGLQHRCDPQRHWLLPFIRSGALGKTVMARAQWHKKQSWRVASPNADREKAINWRLDKSTSPGLIGEIGIHAIDQAGWFLNLDPIAITGFGSTILWKDGREVPDTVQLVVEYPGGVRMNYDASLATSFDSDYELLYGTDATVMMRDGAAWMFKEVDSPLLGWEVYARKDSFYKESGISLMAGSSKQTALTGGGSNAPASAFPYPPLFYSLDAFMENCEDTKTAIEDYVGSGFDLNDKPALGTFIASNIRRVAAPDMADSPRALLNSVQNAPRHDAGFAATVLALKANEAITKGIRVELKKEMFELS